MAQRTKIEWASMSSNAIRAINKQNGKEFHFCTKCGIGCAHCYSEAMNTWVGNGLRYTKQNEKHVEFKVHYPELEKLVSLKKPQRIFMHDMTDLFHHLITDEMLDTCFEVYETLTMHTLMVLTKRPERMAGYFSKRYSNMRIPEHFWVGTSASVQKDADENIPHLLKIPASVRFLSAEPLLGEINLQWSTWFNNRFEEKHNLPANAVGLELVLAGGESGRKARPCNIEWLYHLLKQCRFFGIPFFCKQLGSVYAKAHGLSHPKGGDWNEWPEELRIREFPKC